jgi:NADH-quinone oxidoreductase subunit M
MIDYYKKAPPGEVGAAKNAEVFDAVARLRQAANGNKQDTPINTFDLVLLHKVGRESARIEARYDSALEELASDKPAVRKNGEANLKSVQADIANKFLLFPRGFQHIMFILLFIGFAIKVPVFPFHTWLPDAHVEAPTPISMILAGVLLKMGGYGIIRIAYPICPIAAYDLSLVIGVFGMINIVYGAFAAMAQTDFKRLVAYSSVSHMGYVILGVAVWSTFDKSQFWSWGMNGAMFQMIAHGITSAGMFFLVGVVYDRVHHRDLNALGGINNTMPLYSGISAVIFFGAMGLPGLCGFVGEFFTVLGTWNYSIPFSFLAALTVVITAAYILWTIQRVYLGQSTVQFKEALSQEITLREMLCITPLVVLAVLLGVWPNLVLDWMEPSVSALVNDLSRIIPPKP